MKLSMWHCEALYVIGRVPIDQLTALSGISYAAIKGSVMCDKWDVKRAKYLGLDEDHAYDIYTINIIINEFSHDTSKVAFVNGILDKIKNRENAVSGISASGASSRRDQHIAMLSEFGIDSNTANTLVSNIENDIGDRANNGDHSGNGDRSGSVSVITSNDEFDDMKIGLQDELDTINLGYKYLVDAHDINSSQIHNDLREKIKFFSSMIADIEAKMPATLSFEELISAQRNIRHAASAYASLVQLHYDTGGLKGYVNHHAAIAKLFGQGYMVIKRDEMGRLIESSGDS